MLSSNNFSKRLGGVTRLVQWIIQTLKVIRHLRGKKKKGLAVLRLSNQTNKQTVTRSATARDNLLGLKWLFGVPHPLSPVIGARQAEGPRAMGVGLMALWIWCPGKPFSLTFFKIGHLKTSKLKSDLISMSDLRLDIWRRSQDCFLKSKIDSLRCRFPRRTFQSQLYLYCWVNFARGGEAPKLLRAIRVGPNEGWGGNWGEVHGSLSSR